MEWLGQEHDVKNRLPFYALAALSLLPVAMTAGQAAPAPRVTLSSLDKLPQPLPLPYDETADANRQVAAAKARAVSATVTRSARLRRPAGSPAGLG